MVFHVRWVGVHGYALNEYRSGFFRTVGHYNSLPAANKVKKRILRRRMLKRSRDGS